MKLQSPIARKASKGTSYQAEGLQKPEVDSEIGSSIGVSLLELVPDLVSPQQRTITYGKMMNDAGVDVSMRASKTPVLGAEFFMDPYSDSPLDMEISDFIWANLAEGMSAPFVNSLEDILHFYEDGYSNLEKVYELREWSPNRKQANTRKYTMLKKLAVRPPSTTKNIQYDDNGGPVAVSQNARRADGSVQEVTIPISKLLVFTFSRKGGDLTGKSLLRTAYPHWYYKTHFYKLDAVQKERHGIGVPKGKLLPGYTAADKRILRTLLRNLRSNEEAFIMETPNVEITFAEVKGQLVNILESANHHNMMILMNCLAQFLALGIEGAGGGRATGGTQADLFMKSLKFVANYITEVINMYLIPELVVWNYKTTNFPKLGVRNIGETRDIQMLASALANLFHNDVVTNDLPTENWTRKIFDMPSKQPNAEPTSTNNPKPASPDGTVDPVTGQPVDNSKKNGRGSVQPGKGNSGKPPIGSQ